MDYRQAPLNAAETEPLGLLQLVINCKEFHSRLEKNLAEQVRLIRNELFHSRHFKVEDDDLKESIADMVKLLQSGQLANDSSAKQAVERLQKIEHVDLTFEDEVKLWREIIDKCKDNKGAILTFVTSYKDLGESLRPEIEQLKREVKEINGTACII
ncbi:hypothetical protein LSAT2_012728 [Lamellibrachia satsuma]|nr:hypothetical protein LSAT2_012728 [Lamellibrachia satsuma]